MNILLAIKPDYAAAILAGTKTVELRSYLPAKLRPGDTIYLVGSGRVWGHCTFAGATPMPTPVDCRERWLESIATPAAVPVSVARQHLSGSPRHSATGAAAGYAWHVRYPVSYEAQGRKYDGAAIKRFVYVTGEPSPAETHPRLANYLLYLQTHKTP
jgi:hypothetical protein